MKNIEVFDGNQLHELPVTYNVKSVKCSFIGTTPVEKSIYLPFDDDLLSRHILFLGGIGTGKTTAISQVLNQLQQSLTTEDVVIVFDAKGDYLKKFYRPGIDVVISNDDNATGPNGKDYWNIFREIEPDRYMKGYIIEIAKTLFRQRAEKSQQPFFPNAAKDLFVAILTHFTRNSETLSSDNQALSKLLFSSPIEEIREILKQHEDLKAMTSYIAGDNPQTQGVISELQQLSREIFLENFAKQGTLSMRELVRAKGGRIIFIEYDMKIGNLLSPIYSLLYDLAIKEALGRNENDISRGNVYFINDEFSLIPSLQHVDDAVNFGRSLGIKFMIGIQNIDQIFENYGEKRARSLLSGFLTSVSFRVNDEHSREFIRGLHGKNRKKETYSSVIQSRGLIEQIRDGNVIEDWDISRLEIGQAIMGLPGKEPFLFKFKEV